MIDLSSLKPHLKDKPVAVVGLGKSGMPVFEACRNAGIQTVLWDDNEDQRKSAALKGATIENLTEANFNRFSLLCLAPGIPLTHPKPHPCVARAQAAGVEIVGDIELFHRARSNVRTIGITGTNGKSTTTALVGHILSEAKIPSAIGGNIGEAILTLPDLPAGSVYTIEMSSYQIDLCPTFSPDIAVLINFSPDHLDRHGDMEGYVATKEKIFKGKGIAIIGVDDPWSLQVCERVKKQGLRQVIPVSCQKTVENGITVTADGLLYDRENNIIDLKTCPALKGQHNWQNAAIAYAACLAAGASALHIIKGLQSFPGLAHRQSIVTVLNGVTYVNDSKATNDQSASMALAAYDPIYWIAGGKPKEGGYQDCTRYLPHVRHAFLIGEAEDSLSQWLDTQKTSYTRCGTLEKALETAHRLAQSEKLVGAAVLLSPACASFDQFRNFEHRGDVFTTCVHDLTSKNNTRSGGEKI
jgi:UDP-N-acetylmuramoylalanine--D-glutamate ligase